eukprot:CAMPEP_0201546162 /NCGR_PEP_ID=MMETSP0173_2-20130828/2535_1 /ASSEMBLY_ACC=CAM_ASM_000268 /TAXON_ID=218659 /ORGANISM="Vexillifera sp., Strain DIVA3 564/2" /LENGTH=441 /DNA_ID=CAMNT_0047954765 /DNA_START=89 /DNA_END=1414 /DNA_ORIENTATION=-
MSLGLDPKYWYYNGEAYDFTDFVDRHPGGQWALMLAKGHECSTLFHSYHLDPTGKPLQMLKKYRLPDDQQPGHGMFEPSKKFTFKEDGFYAVVKKAAREYFAEKQISHYADWAHVTGTALTHLFMFIFMYLMCCSEFSLTSLIIFGAIHGIARAMLVVQTVHAASHYSFSRSPTINRWLYRIGTILIGLWAPPVWDIQHVIAHHVYTNEWPFDTDSAFPIKSIHANQRRLPYHRYQHLYMWVVYAFTIPLVLFNSVRVILTRKQMLFKLTFDVPGSYLEGVFCTIFGIGYLALPFFFLPFTTALIVTTLNNVLSSLIFALQFIVNHEIDEVVHHHPEEGKEYDWGEFEVMTSANFGTSSLFSLEVSGGLNTQIEHHLFPSIHYGHYKELAKVVQRVIKDQFPHINYISKPSLWEALRSHYRLLKNPPKSVRQSKKKLVKAN